MHGRERGGPGRRHAPMCANRLPARKLLNRLTQRLPVDLRSASRLVAQNVGQRFHGHLGHLDMGPREDLAIRTGRIQTHGKEPRHHSDALFHRLEQRVDLLNSNQSIPIGRLQ